MRITMWNRSQKLLLALSLGVNVAFIAIWVAHAVPNMIAEQRVARNVADHAAVSSPLHREIGVTAEQWKEIEPHVRYFQKKAQEQRRMISALRGQLMELLASASVDEAAIRAKQEEILSGQREMQTLVIQLLLKEKQILTSDQQRALLRVIHQHCSCREESGYHKNGIGRVLSDDLSSRRGDNDPK